MEVETDEGDAYTLHDDNGAINFMFHTVERDGYVLLFRYCEHRVGMLDTKSSDIPVKVVNQLDDLRGEHDDCPHGRC